MNRTTKTIGTLLLATLPLAGCPNASESERPVEIQTKTVVPTGFGSTQAAHAASAMYNIRWKDDDGKRGCAQAYFGSDTSHNEGLNRRAAEFDEAIRNEARVTISYTGTRPNGCLVLKTVDFHYHPKD
jgi:hypothetical protein